MTQQNVRISCCPCYFDYYVFALNQQKDCDAFDDLFRMRDALTSYYVFIRQDTVYHTYILCLEHFLHVTVFKDKKFIWCILDRNGIVKRHSDVNCSQYILKL